MAAMKKLVVIVAVTALALALSAQAVASWTGNGNASRIGETTVRTESLSSIENLLKEGTKVSFSGELDASGGYGKVKVSGEMAVTSVRPVQP
jgi:hypothetical protein